MQPCVQVTKTSSLQSTNFLRKGISVSEENLSLTQKKCVKFMSNILDPYSELVVPLQTPSKLRKTDRSQNDIFVVIDLIKQV